MIKKDKTLWKAASTGKYPHGTTIADLANCRDDSNHTALHRAAHCGCLPDNTTVADLANCKDIYGNSALHDVAHSGYFPADTTVADLTNCRTDYGTTAWDMLILRFNNSPTNILNTPPNLFKDHHHLAVQWVNKAIENDPDLKAKATLWLSKVLAANPSTPYRTP